MKNWIRRSFQNRIFATVLLITLIPLLLCNVLMLQLQVTGSRREQQRSARLQVQALEEELDALWAQLDAVSAGFSRSTPLRSVLRRGIPDSRVVYQVLFRDTRQLRQYACFSLYDTQGKCLYTTDEGAAVSLLDADWGLLRSAAGTQDLCCRSGTGDDALAAARAIRGHGGNIAGFAVITLDRQNLDRLFASRFDASSQLLLLDAFFDPVYCSQSAGGEETARVLRRQLLSGQPLTDPQGQCSYAFAASPATGLNLVLSQPMAFTHQALIACYSISAVLALMSLALCLLCAWWLSRHLSRPVNRMDEAMAAVRQGDYSIHLDLQREDELGRLADSFNRMTREYRANLDRSLQRQQELNAAQIRLMQAQLNPHFLYNTLDSIKWLGVTHQVPQVSAMATDLAAVLRSSVSQEALVTLEQELELIERYLDIQYLRYADRFTCEEDIPEQFQHCLIPKLSVQPLVENAILHAVADQDDGYIKITACLEDGDLLLCVSDNGCGIPKPILDRLNSPDKRIPGHHLGIYNVDQIARLHFGPGYGIRVWSEPGQGSRVYLKLPVLPAQEPEKEENHAQSIGH